MATIHQRITNCLWFDSEAEEAANFYTSIFPNSSIGTISRYGKEGFEQHQQPEGKVMLVMFTLDGQEFMGLNGGPLFPFTEAISLVVNCKDQAEIDYYWDRLTKGGQEVQCGWLKDKFGVSWQVNPIQMRDMMAKGTPEQLERVTAAYMKMKKFDLKTLEEAYRGSVSIGVDQ
jgi:predicted 3-demethylubiquinone-9 3-methyltransferase (glyoxalase superfamily)